MKSRIFLTLASVVFIAGIGYSQCYKKILCKEDLNDYDYTGQSTYATLLPGDTAQFDVILYSGKDYKVMLCSEPKLGDIQYSIFNKTKTAQKTVKDVVKKTEPVYKKDEYGQKMYDGNYKPIIEGYKTVYDTVWMTKVSNVEDVVFNNKRDGKVYWEEKNVTKTKRIIIQVIIPPNSAARYEKGCASVLVGYRQAK